MSYNTKWVGHITDPVERDLFGKNLEANVVIFGRMKQLLEDKIKYTEDSKRSLKSYTINNYSEFQADRNATVRTLEEIIDLLPKEAK